MKTIVVGIDGSEHGEAALAFAAEEAALRGAHLLIVCAWQTPMVVDPGGLFPPQAFEGLAENARSIAEAAVARVAELQPLGTCEGKAVKGSQPLSFLRKPNRPT